MSNAKAKEVIQKWVKNVLDKGVPALRKDFNDNKRYFPKDISLNAFKEAHPLKKNRYKDVPMQDKNRIVLNFPGGTGDYIHANYVSTPNSEKRFICTQGPLENTVVDFYRMIMQEEIECIIMLCNLVEKGQPKCFLYWPDKKDETKKFDDFEITCIDKSELEKAYPNIIKSTIKIKSNYEGKKCEQIVKHIYWSDWPDRGVPVNTDSATTLLNYVRGTTKPILVHCSAGIGRTGSIVAIEYILEKFVNGESPESPIEIFKIIRDQRPYSIQTELQFLFVQKVILDLIVGNNKKKMDSKMLALLEKFEKDYEEACNQAL
uniref:Tyrosine-protein phosphatase domain-containing protein n=1 Tax=Strongyloides papillosus TaxID=174720 RepID=A0A0N5C5F6_STREA